MAYDFKLWLWTLAQITFEMPNLVFERRSYLSVLIADLPLHLRWGSHEIPNENHDERAYEGAGSNQRADDLINGLRPPIYPPVQCDACTCEENDNNHSLQKNLSRCAKRPAPSSL